MIEGLAEEHQETNLVCRKGSRMATKAYRAGFRPHETQRGVKTMLLLNRIGKQYDVLHAQTGSDLTWCLASRVVHGKPVVYTRRLYHPLSSTAAMKIKQADAVVAISPAIQRQMEDGGVKRIRQISSGVKEFPLNPRRAQVILEKYNPQQLKVIGLVAALIPDKDPVTAIRAIAELRKKRDDFVCIHLGEGELRAEAENEIARLDLLDTYHLAGHNEDLEDFFAIFNAFFLPSIREGLGSSVLDAFLYKVPVVTTETGGLAALAKDRGVLCEVGNAAQMAEGLDEALNRTERIERCVENAREYVLAHHDVGEICKQYVALYEEVIARKN